LWERVIGQVEAVRAISRAVRRARSGLADGSRPVASMIFSGPTGVGGAVQFDPRLTRDAV